MTTEHDDSAPLTHVEQAMAYYGGDLEGAEKADFEKHLATCTECQRALERAKVDFPLVNAMLGVKPLHTIEAQAALFAKQYRANRAALEQQVRLKRLTWAGVIGFALAASVLIALSPRPAQKAVPEIVQRGADAGAFVSAPELEPKGERSRVVDGGK